MNKRMIVVKKGGKKVLRLLEEKLTAPVGGEVKIRVKVAGVSFADLMVREGLYPGIRGPQVTPGYEVAGIVEEVGAAVTGIRKGDAVVALTQIGGYSTHLNVSQERVVKQPPGLDQADAVSMVLNYLTAYQLLHRVARVIEGEKILIHGAAGGVGSALLQLGKLHNLEMWGTASKGKHDLVRSLGGVPIDYNAEDFVNVVTANEGGGVDAVFDPIGGSNWRRSYKALRLGGKVVGYGFSEATTSGHLALLKAVPALLATPRFSFYNMYQENKGMLGYFIWNLNNERPSIYQEDMSKLLSLLEAGKIAPIVSERIPLMDANRAHQILNESRVAGKIVLEC
ncbi:hypothetical protein A9Q99_04585 [Gammaproteobacteria bacterium 45_16_T64]|nr:hypothetical protein A9Q99_04585 [Gammaproteobacteria bacterium 45_16_T64]